MIRATETAASVQTAVEQRADTPDTPAPRPYKYGRLGGPSCSAGLGFRGHGSRGAPGWRARFGRGAAVACIG